jgi:acyl-CoA thioesterase
MTFESITRVEDMVWNVPEGWRQGRGAFGGLTLATLARVASEHASAEGRPLRSLTAEIPGAVLVGPANVRVTPLRVGSGLSTLATQLEQNGEVVAHAVCSFGKTRVVDFDRNDVPAPSPPPFADIAPIPTNTPGPEFFPNFEIRLIKGMPFAGEKDAVTEGWVRLREPDGIARSVALVALLDAWFPSVFPVLSAPRPFGTISFAAHFFEREWSLQEPLHHRSRLIASQQGYFAEVRELFTPRGELCAINQQTLAVIK